MIIQDKSRSSENRSFLSLSKTAFLFWCSFIMGLFALFFFVGTLVGRGQIQVDLGQNALFQEINGVADSTATNTETETVQSTEEIPGDGSDLDFYSELPKENGKNPDTEIEVATTPSTKKKTKQVIKKNLDIVKPDHLDDAEASSSELPSESTVATKQAREPKEKANAERVVPVTMTTSAEKPKAESTQKPKATSEDKTKTDTPTKTKPETADKTKAESSQKTKAETADKPKSDSGAKEKTAALDKTKKTEKPKTAEKEDANPKKFSLQVAALRSADDADDMVKKLNGLGFSAYTVKSGENEPWYKVRVGTYKDRTEAEKTITKLKSKNFDAFVVNR
jgi:cell division protein FtsN